MAGDCCPRVPGPTPQPAVPFRPRLLLREPTTHPTLAAPFVKSPRQVRVAHPQEGRAHRACHHHVPGHCQLLIEERPSKDLLFVGQNIRGLSINLTLISVSAELTSSVPAAFWPRTSAAQTQQGRGAVWTHRPLHQASTNRKSTLPVHLSKLGTDQVQRPNRFYLGFCC